MSYDNQGEGSTELEILFSPVYTGEGQDFSDTPGYDPRATGKPGTRSHNRDGEDGTSPRGNLDYDRENDFDTGEGRDGNRGARGKPGTRPEDDDQEYFDDDSPSGAPDYERENDYDTGDGVDRSRGARG